MRKAPIFSRSLLLLLACLIPPSVMGQTISAPAAGKASPLPAAVGAVSALPASFLDSLSVHLDQTGLRLGSGLADITAPSIEALGAGRESSPPTVAPDLGPGAAEYLAHASLTGDLGAAPSADAQAAAVLARTLADPLTRESLLAGLRSHGGERGAEIASRIEALARTAGTNPYLRQLAADLSASASDPGCIAALFDGSSRQAPELRTPEEFASYAARRFMGGRLLPGGKAGIVYSRPKSTAPEAVPGDQEMVDEMALSPLTNPEREKVVADLFRQAGANPEEIQFQDTGYGTHNVFVVKKGRTDRVVVLGAHHDKADVGHGTIDNWTGATMVPNLYQALAGVETEATMIFAVFAREEDGLVGSSKFVRSLSAQQRSKIDAMLNMDTLAVDGTFLWKNNSDESLLKRMVAVAKRAALAAAEVVFWGGDADSSSFRRAGIPALTVFGASPGIIFDIVHSENDTMKVFSLPHYKNAYSLVLETLKELDASPIGRAGRQFLRAARTRLLDLATGMKGRWSTFSPVSSS